MGHGILVVRYGELFLKGENRPFFEQKLLEAIDRALADLTSAQVDIQRLHGRILVHAPKELLSEAQARVCRVFGVTSVLLARSCRADLAELTVTALDCLRAAGHDRVTFKVETFRSDKRFPMPSMEVSRLVGAAIVEKFGWPVDVRKPALRVGIEIGTQATFVWLSSDELPGPGGLPMGTAGRVLLLLSGGIDSPVAGWLLQKRGCELGAVYFHSFPYTGDKTRDKVTDLARILARSQQSLALHVVHFTDVQKALRQAGPAELAVVLYRRMMLRIADLLAEQHGYLALATGENLGQVASQTLENMRCIEAASTLPILRPLLTYDKIQTTALARRIGTYDLSVLPYDDCCSLFVPEHPATRVRIPAAERAERNLKTATLALDCAKNADRYELLRGDATRSSHSMSAKS